ncbi:hypothetical protein BofuT4_uP088920.1 [Botrytis cinerea T4]|uniref:Uncharacterized protein n=1 Tax=Botryotinia fuckeliana (strain T4) TaxID=999810 RepID=G2YFE5_BOTF4|nr:hypothetical protein BofuT4_uP088920.1 [Botrytis cinerea T4]
MFSAKRTMAYRHLRTFNNLLVVTLIFWVLYLLWWWGIREIFAERMKIDL